MYHVILPGSFCYLNVCSWILPGWARACGGALKVLIVGPDGWGDPWIWTTITFIGVAFVLFGPKQVYASLEHTVEALVVLITVGLIAIAFSVGDLSTWKDLGSGMLNIPYKDPDMAMYVLFSSIVFAGAGGTANLFFSFYIRDKGWGMGALVPKVLNPLREREETTADRAFQITSNEQNLQRWNAWFRHLHLGPDLVFLDPEYPDDFALHLWCASSFGIRAA